MTKNKLLITISHYNERDKSNLLSLSTTLTKQNCDLFTVINDDICKEEFLGKFNDIKTLTITNSGMNISSLNASYLNNKNYDFYLSLQNECIIMDPFFLSNYIDELSKKDDEMTWESINMKWNNSCDVISKSGLNYLIEYDINKKTCLPYQILSTLFKKMV